MNTLAHMIYDIATEHHTRLSGPRKRTLNHDTEEAHTMLLVEIFCLYEPTLSPEGFPRSLARDDGKKSIKRTQSVKYSACMRP